jgi:ABC-type branched-subunit amino acid transport system substrate-binding protein
MDYRKRVRRTLSAGLALVIAFSFACATAVKKDEPYEVPKEVAEDLKKLTEATRLAKERADKEKTIANYIALTENFPTSEEAEAAWYHLGVHYLGLKDYRLAFGSFESLIRYFKDSRYYFNSYINMGITLVYLKRHDQAEQVLQKALGDAKTPLQRSTILYNLGENSYLYGEYAEALNRFVLCTGIDSIYKAQAQRRVRLVIHNVLSERQLLVIVKKYRDKYPADVVYLELADIYRRNADTRSYARIKKRIVKYFPHIELPEDMPIEEDRGPIEGVTIGCILPLSGDDSERGAAALKGIQLAFSMNGQIVERSDVRLLIKDSASDPKIASEKMQELAEDSTVIAIIGPLSENELRASMPVARAYSIPILSPAYFPDDFAEYKKFLFPIGVTENQQGKFLAELAVERLGYFRMIVMHPEDDYGDRLMSSFVSTAEELGAEIAVVTSYDIEANDFGEQIKKIGGMHDTKVRDIVLDYIRVDEELTPEEINENLEMDYQNGLTIPYITKYKELPLTHDNFSVGLRANFDAIFVPASPERAGLILPELAFYNLTHPQVIGSDQYASKDFVRIGGKYAEQSIFPYEFYSRPREYTMKRFVKNYKKAFAQTPELAAARSFDAVTILLVAVNDGATAKEVLIDSLNDLQPYRGASGEFSGGLDYRLVKTPFLFTVRNRRIITFDPDNPLPPIKRQKRKSPRV